MERSTSVVQWIQSIIWNHWRISQVWLEYSNIFQGHNIADSQRDSRVTSRGTRLGEESSHQDYKFSSTGYESNDYSLTETYAEFNKESVTEQRFPEDLGYDDAVIGQTLFNAYRRRVDHSEEGLSSCLSSSSMSHDRKGQPVVEGHEIQRQNSESEQIRTLLERQREQIFADCQAEIRKHEFQADYDRRSIQKLSDTIESQQEELHRAQGDERRRQCHQLLHGQLFKQNWDLREAHEKSFKEMRELKKFQSSTFDTIARRKLVEDQDTIIELTSKIQELQNEINCVNDSRDSQDAGSVRSGQSHVTSQSVSFPRHPVPGGMLSRSKGMPSRKDGPPSICDTHGLSGNVFYKSNGVFFSTLSARVKSMEF